MDNLQDNANAAPLIPSGTQPTVFGTGSFMNQGQVPAAAPEISKPVGETPQTNSVQAPIGTTFAELAVKKGFKSPDDLAKAYENLESHNKKVEMTAAELVALKEQISQPVQNQIPAQPTHDEAIKIVENIVLNKIKPLEDKVVLQELFLKNPDASQYASDMAKAIKDNPGISWEAAYKLAKYDKLQSQSLEQGKQQAYQNVVQKQTLQAGKSQPTNHDNKDMRSMIKDRSIPFSEITKIVRERLQQ